MNQAFLEQVRAAVAYDKESYLLVVALIEHEYEFQCPAFIMAGPGHQSKHECTYHRPHNIDGEHSDDLYTWQGTHPNHHNVYGSGWY